MTQTQYGVCLPIFACPGVHLFRTPGFNEIDPSAALRIARLAEELKFDSLWVADHLMLGKRDAILEGWTVLSALAGATTTPKLGMIHMANYFRNPALVAKMVATIDQISGGRLIHFLDCGYLRREYVSYGMPWQEELEERAADLSRASSVMLNLWASESPLTMTGTYRVENAIEQPKPLQTPHPPLWFGEVAQGVLDLCARVGQGWNSTPVALPELRRRLALLKMACAGHGRTLDDLELSLETQVLIGDDIGSVRRKLKVLIELGGEQDHMPAEIAPYVHAYAHDHSTKRFVAGETDELPEPMASDWLIGTPEQVRARLNAYKSEGISHFMLWFMDLPDESGMKLLAETIH